VVSWLHSRRKANTDIPKYPFGFPYFIVLRAAAAQIIKVFLPSIRIQAKHLYFIYLIMTF